MAGTRRVRCAGPLCAEKKRDDQLHPRAGTVRLPDGSRLCVDCAMEMAGTRPRDPEPPAELPLTLTEDAAEGNGSEPVTEPLGEPVVTEQLERSLHEYAVGGKVPAGATITVMPGTTFLPAPTAQVDLGDPLAYTIFPDVPVEGWPLRKGRLSASSLGTFVTCPEKFRRKQVLGDREPGNGAMVAGGAAHKAVEANYRHVQMTGTAAPPKLWREWLDAKFEKEAQENISDWGRRGWGGKDPFSKDEVHDRAVIAAQTYIEHVAPSYYPLGVEEPFVVWVEGCPVPVVGSKDLVTERDVVDVKFGKPHSLVQPDWRLQGLIYGLTGDLDMAWHCVGWPKQDGTCTFHSPIDSPGLRFKRSYERYVIATDLVRNTVAAIMSYASTFGTEDPWPANLAHTWACDSCVFRKNDTCPWWHRAIKAEDLL